MDTYENNISHNISYNKYKYPWGKQLLNENISEDMNDKIISYLIIVEGISLNQILMIQDFKDKYNFRYNHEFFKSVLLQTVGEITGSKCVDGKPIYYTLVPEPKIVHFHNHEMFKSNCERYGMFKSNCERYGTVDYRERIFEKIMDFGYNKSITNYSAKELLNKDNVKEHFRCHLLLRPEVTIQDVIEDVLYEYCQVIVNAIKDFVKKMYEDTFCEKKKNKLELVRYVLIKYVNNLFQMELEPFIENNCLEYLAFIEKIEEKGFGYFYFRYKEIIDDEDYNEFDMERYISRHPVRSSRANDPLDGINIFNVPAQRLKIKRI